MVDRFETTDSAEWQSGSRLDAQTSLSILESMCPADRALLPWGGMIRDQADNSPLNLMKVGNETLEEVEKKVVCCTYYFIHLYIIYRKKYIYNKIYFYYIYHI